MKTSSQCGNVIFVILIATILFASLSYAVNKSMRGSGSVGQTESLQIKVTQLLQYTGGLREAVQHMVLSGIPPQSIDLNGANAGVPCSSGTASCVFGSNGGGATEMKLQADPDIDQYGNGYGYFEIANGMIVAGAGTPAPDIIIGRSFKQTPKGKELCEAINKALGIPSMGVNDSSVPNTYNGAPGRRVACIRDGTDSYIFYQVLYDN